MTPTPMTEQDSVLDAVPCVRVQRCRGDVGSLAV